ncbi:hypothetical protein V6N13_044608 [Hibiscus sabdariffa]|uniref:Kinesin motor domain-containing protein n=1 Tax=Hibiscus sabdariffa TaxID=183260 RepID=A0ABR2RJ41_9ROSI
MEGTDQNRGVNYRTLELFQIAKERSDSFTYNISVGDKQSAEGFHHVPGIIEAQVENIKEVWDVLQIGSNSRVVGSNNVNEHSS